jgi:hypothetical protein
VDDIVLHQILQWHNMLSANVAPPSYASTQANWHRRLHLRFRSVGLADLYAHPAVRRIERLGHKDNR